MSEDFVIWIPHLDFIEDFMKDLKNSINVELIAEPMQNPLYRATSSKAAREKLILCREKLIIFIQMIYIFLKCIYYQNQITTLNSDFPFLPVDQSYREKGTKLNKYDQK